MANMAWNSVMNAGDTRRMLTDKREDGECWPFKAA
jgi:hypothetical protein